MLNSLAPARRRLVLAVSALVLVGAVVGVTFAVVGGGDPVAPRPQGTAGPVVLVPGYGGSTSGLNDLASLLRAHGKDATVVGLPDNGQGDLDAQARALGNAVDAVISRTHASTVDLVGYSAGGVVARLWVRDQGGAAKTRRVVTLGSPHHGTDLAQLAGTIAPGACPQACQQLEPASELLHALNSGDETPSGPTWVSIWTTKDNVVVPADSASLHGALNLTVQSICPSDGVNHGGLPTDPDVASIVLSELGSGQPARPTTCTALTS